MLATIDWTEVTPKCEKHLAEVVQPILAKHGAKLLATNFNDANYVQRMIVIEYRGEQIEIGSTSFQRERHIEWFLANFDEVKAIADNFTRPGGNLSPFHSNIYHYFRAKWGERHGQRPIDNAKNPTEIGYSYVCRAVEKAGGKVWCD